MASNSEISQKSFNPSWMQASPLKMPKPNGTHRVSNEDDDNSASLELMQPIFANHRYGREDILALIPKDSNGPPDGLSRCPYFLEKPSTPIILTNLNETEQRIQHNINSSKALSAAHRNNEWPSKENNDVSGSNSPQTGWTIAGSSRTTSSFRSGNNRWTAPTNNNEGPRKGYPGFGRQGAEGNSEKPRLPKTSWAESNGGNGFKVRTHLKSGGEDETDSPDQLYARWRTEDEPKADGWRTVGNKPAAAEMKAGDWRVTHGEPKQNIGGWRTGVQNKTNERPKVSDSQQKSILSNLELLEGEPKTKENIWASAGLHNTIWTPPSSLQNANEIEKPTHIAHSSSSSLEQQKSIEAEVNVQRSKISPTRINPNDLFDIKPDQWFYLDPQSVQRGPFTGDQMQAWFLNGYFQQDLKIMQPGDTSYTPLGELIKLNGALTPFYSVKTQNPSPIGKNSTVSSNTSNNLPWAQQREPIQRPQAQEEQKNNFRGAELSLESLKLLEVKERMIAEEQRKLKEKQEALERDREEKSKALLEMQMQLEKQRQEIEKKAREQELQAELHRMQILEYESQQRKKLEQLEAEQLKIQQEEIMRRRQIEIQKAEEERRAMLELQRQRELKQKEESERLMEAARLREKQELAAYERQQKALQEQQMAQQLAVQQQKIMAQQLAQQQKILASSKAAPWSSSANQSSKGTEFRAIQEQERLELLTKKMLEDEKRKELEAEQKRVASSTQGNGNPWNVVKVAKPATIPPTKEHQPQPKSAKNQAAKTSKPQPVKEVKETKETKVEDPLTAWVIQSIKKISTNVDPEIFATFLQGIESPNEVEDYIYTYFGETKRAKEFHQEFLSKRIELRPRREKKGDDLSGPARSATDIPSSSSGAKAPGKKPKKVKKVVDISTYMNFRPAGDSSRFNVGEIDTELPAPLKKGKKK